MARMACPKCGHRVDSTDFMCNKCGYFLGDTDTATQQQVETSTAEPWSEQPQEYSTQNQYRADDVIRINTRGSLFSILPMVVPVGMLAILYYMIFVLSLSVYYSLPILILLFILPPITRRLAFPIKFSGSGFRVPKAGGEVVFRYSNIEGAVVNAPGGGIQEVTLSMREGTGNVTLDFDQVISLRQFLVHLQRNRIPISIYRQQLMGGFS